MSKQTELAQVADTITVNSGNVGIGTSSPNTLVHLSGTSEVIRIEDTDATLAANQTIGKLEFYSNDASGAGVGVKASVKALAEDSIGRTSLVFSTADSSSNDTEAMRIDSSGNLLVSTTAATVPSDGAVIAVAGGNSHSFAKSGKAAVILNRSSSDGDIAVFRKNNTTVGSIESFSSVTLGLTLRLSPQTGPAGLRGAQSCLVPFYEGADRDNELDLGRTETRWDDIYATNQSIIGTSDRREKQDIAELDEAEQRVAVACKGLLRKFRWIDAVAKKGDDARIHFGIIAQDLQAAFAAEGLDAGRYGMFIHNTWWETQTEVPAVEAVAEVLDEDGNVVTEAVEAVDAYTRTDTYDTQEEAPEGAVERDRMGVRMTEILAFIIGAL